MIRVFRAIAVVGLSVVAASLHAESIQTIADSDLPVSIANSRGMLVVHISSLDKGCGPCVKSNPELDKLAVEISGTATYRRVLTQPWTNIGSEIKKFNLVAIPTVLVFQDGKLISRYLGSGLSGKGPLRTQLEDARVNRH